jgi:hypothetical protein
MITIEVTHRSGGYYVVRFEDRVLTKQTRTPLLTASRIPDQRVSRPVNAHPDAAQGN